jgi:lactoylglutathione lyase
MYLNHLAIWAEDLERLKEFYTAYFSAVAGEKYTNPKKKFESYFLSFPSGARLELMKRADVAQKPASGLQSGPHIGLAHFAFSVGSQAEVDALTEKLKAAGYTVADGPRWTGDGYYESIVLDPEGNVVEITV